MNDTSEALLKELRDYDYAEGYAEALLNAHIAMQIKVLREQQGMKQAELASLMGTGQTVISRIENVNYSSWSIRTLKKIARALKLRLNVSFESFGSLPDEMGALTRENLERVPHDQDPQIWASERTKLSEENHTANASGDSRFLQLFLNLEKSSAPLSGMDSAGVCKSMESMTKPLAAALAEQSKASEKLQLPLLFETWLQQIAAPLPVYDQVQREHVKAAAIVQTRRTISSKDQAGAGAEVILMKGPTGGFPSELLNPSTVGAGSKLRRSA